MRSVLQYAAKVVEGRSDGAAVAPGEYWTAANVCDPSERANNDVEEEDETNNIASGNCLGVRCPVAPNQQSVD